MDWIADGVSLYEQYGIAHIARIAAVSAATAEVIALTWVDDGVSGIVSDLNHLANLAESNYAAFESVIAMPWVVDGVSDPELSAIGDMSRIAESSQAVFESVIAMPWVVDGVSDTEAYAIKGLYHLAVQSADAAARVAAMLKDGITDDEALIVSFLDIVRYRAPNLIDTLLDPYATTVERRTVELWLAGEVELAIVRTSPGATQSMDLLENAVRETEKFMGEPLPTPYVRLLYENVTGSAGGVNFGGTHIAIRPEYEGYAHIIAHEVAHYYWLGNADWVDEGMAELMASVIENRRVGTPVKFTPPPCARNLKALEALAPGWDDPGHICNYSIGERLFVSLLLTLGEDAFWEGALNLYAASLDSDGGAGIEEVRQAFGPDAGEVIDFWYTGEVTIND